MSNFYKVMSNILFLLASSSLVVAVLYALVLNLNNPEVVFSYETSKCIKVINNSKNDFYSCDNLPDKYEHVWVK